MLNRITSYNVCYTKLLRPQAVKHPCINNLKRFHLTSPGLPLPATYTPPDNFQNAKYSPNRHPNPKNHSPA